MHHYPFHPGDYMLDTAHLSLEADACYRRCLDLYYVSEAPLTPSKQMLSKRLRVPEALLEEVLAEFFEEREDGFHHARCDEEISRYKAKSEKRKEAGSLGGKARIRNVEANAKQKPSKRQAIASNQELEPRTKNHSTNPLTPNGERNDDFETFWHGYPRKIGKENARKAWVKMKPDLATCMIAISAQKLSEQWRSDGGRFIPHPATWINGGRWDDELNAAIQSDVQAIEIDEELGFLTNDDANFHKS